MAKTDEKYEEMKRLKAEDNNDQYEDDTYFGVLATMREQMGNWHEERAEKDLAVPPAPRKKKVEEKTEE